MAGAGASSAAGGMAGSTAGGAPGTGGAAGMGGTVGTGGAAGMGATGGTGGSQAALDLQLALQSTIWHGTHVRDSKTRGFEIEFAPFAELWSEIRNPFGPAREREMRAMLFDDDGRTVYSTVLSPQGWPISRENGRMDTWTIEIVDGSPRKLRTTRDGQTEEFDEGPWPEPTTGLTAIARVFPASGPVFDAYCGQGVLGSIDYATLFPFARGQTTEPEIDMDVVAGVPLDAWVDPSANNQYALRNVPGFDRLGGTESSDQFNFVVLYTGTLDHAGGSIGMRERDDDVKDALWGWMGPGAGGNDSSDLFLEVHGRVFPDGTVDEPSGGFPGGDVPFEALVLRCSTSLMDVHVEVSFGGGPWTLVGAVGTKPSLDIALFPPAM